MVPAFSLQGTRSCRLVKWGCWIESDKLVGGSKLPASVLHQREAPDPAELRSSFPLSPDGQSMAIYDGISLYTLDLATGSMFTLFTIDEPNYMSGVTWQP